MSKKPVRTNKKSLPPAVLWVINEIALVLYFFGHPLYLLLRFLFRLFLQKSFPPKTEKLLKKKSARYRKVPPYLLSILGFLLFFFTTLKLVLLFLYAVVKKILDPMFLILDYFTHLSKKGLLILFLLCVTVFLSLDIYYLVDFLHSLPSPAVLKTRKLALTTKIYDRNGNLLYKVYDRSHNRTLITLSELPPYLKEATIAIEDKDFYKHGALSLPGIIRAFRENLKGGFQGGSTITQQLVKNALLTNERSVDRKIKEVILSIQTELIFSKDEILQMYFNEVGYGGTAYGIEEASQMYFGKPAANLSLAQAALLAGLPAAPTYYSPFGVNPARLKFRQREVLKRMVEDKYLTQNQADTALKEKLVFTRQQTDIKAPHFVMYVKDLLAQKYGEKMVESGGLSVFTTLDLNIQNLAQKEVTQGVAAQKDLNVGNGAALVTNPQTGEILAMVGSTDFFDTDNDGNVNVVLMPRQPGSSIKPVNYAAALTLRRITAASIIQDTPITYRISDTETYSPQNYDGRFHGNVTVRTALSNSLNVPAVKVLAGYGVKDMIDLGQKMGITTWNDRDRFNLALTLGGGEVKMLDMVKVFGTIADSGEETDPIAILKIYDQKGNIIFNNPPPNSRTVLEKGVAFILTSILSDNNSRAMVFGPGSALEIPGHTVAVKTGTTENKKDNWTLGFTPRYLTAVWIGNNNGDPMSPYLESGQTGAAPIWHNIMAALLKNQKDTPPVLPDDIVKVDVCLNGLLACNNCTSRPEYFLKGTQPQNRCPQPPQFPQAANAAPNNPLIPTSYQAPPQMPPARQPPSQNLQNFTGKNHKKR